MSTNSNINHLNLEYAENEIDKIIEKTEGEFQTITVWLKRTYTTCICYDHESGELCGSKDIISKGYYKKKIIHRSNLLKHQILYIYVPRYHCKTCNRSFSQSSSLNFLDSGYTAGTFEYIRRELLAETTTFNHLSKQIGVSPTKLLSTFDDFFRPNRLPIPRVICIDEFYKGIKYKKKYAAVISDWETGKIIDIINSRHTDDLCIFLNTLTVKERNNVLYLTCDFYDAYKDLAYAYFPNVKVVVDEFHLKEIITRTMRKEIANVLRSDKLSTKIRLEKIRGETIEELKPIDYSEDYKYIKKYQDYLFNHYSSKDFYEKSEISGQKYPQSPSYIIDGIFRINDTLKRMYLLVQELYDFIDNTTVPRPRRVIAGKKYSEYQAKLITIDQDEKFNRKMSAAKQTLDQVLSKMARFKPAIFISNVNTFKLWEDEILNSLIRDKELNDKHMTNSLAESNNAQIKKIYYNANGIRNFERFKYRCIYCINKEMPLMHKTNINNQNKVESPNYGKNYDTKNKKHTKSRHKKHFYNQ